MNNVRSRRKNTRSTIAAFLLGVAYAAVFSAVAMGPALAADRDRDHRHYTQSRHYDRDWHHDRHWYGGGYYYAPPPPVYVPPPVYYSPYYAYPYYSSPGINIVVPLRIH